jgi:hypothetical protein
MSSITAGTSARPRGQGSPWPLVPLARAGYGAAVLCAPGPVIRACTGRTPSRAARRVARVVGLRHLIQAAITIWAPAPEVVAVGVLVDLTHAASMLGFAAVNRPLARAELTDALAATVLAVTESLLLASDGPVS